MVSWTTRKANKYVLRQIKAETSLEAKKTKLKLSDFRHIIKRWGFQWEGRQYFWEKCKRKTKYEINALSERSCRHDSTGAEQGC